MRADWAEKAIDKFVYVVARVADDEASSRRVDVRTTIARFRGGNPTTGGPTSAEIFDERVWSRVREWLGLHDSVNEAQAITKVFGGRQYPWPEPLNEAAFHGVAGEFVRLVAPHTEADPAGLLIQFLVAAGNVMGRNVYSTIESTKHGLNLFAVLVGQTSRSRKGTSWTHVRRCWRLVDSGWPGVAFRAVVGTLHR